MSAVNLNRYSTREDTRQNIVTLTCSDCGQVARWRMTGPWPIAVEQKKYQHARSAHGESDES